MHALNTGQTIEEVSQQVNKKVKRNRYVQIQCFLTLQM